MATMVSPTLKSVARLFDYPSEGFESKVGEAEAALSGYQKAREALQSFLREVEGMPIEEQQELYSRTFELSPNHTLDTSNHLYTGYNRTRCLSKMRSMYKAFDFESEHLVRGELPDYLPAVLEFVAVLDDRELKDDFCKTYLSRSLEALLGTFKGDDSPYRHLVDVALQVVRADLKGGK